MAPILQDGLDQVQYFPVVILFCVFILILLILFNCAGDGDTSHAHDPGKRKENKKRQDNPVVPSKSRRAPLNSTISDDSTTEVMNQPIPISSNSSELYVNTYMNAAAIGTRFEPLPFDTRNIIGTLKKSLASHTIDERRLDLHDVIGKGAFGLVYKGALTDRNLKNSTEVAVKTVHGNTCSEDDLKSFLEEVTRMCGFNHPNVQTTIGLCIRSGQPYAVLPFMHHGDMRAFMLSPERVFTIRQLLTFGLQIAKGMEYLAKQKFVHRDLAARNCMIDKSMVIKIADFGLSRDIFESDYYRMHKNSNTPLPVRWMAPESLATQVYTTKTDVWSYGVVLWEITTRGLTPYPKMSSLNAVAYVTKGGRLERPQGCPSVVFALMTNCWNADPSKRPDFSVIVRELNAILKK